MTEKKYRITYNPYKRTTKVEEYYPGASNPWTSLGSEKEPELNHILAGKESIQQICMDLLSWIEEHNNQYSNCKEYEVIFYGIEQDFNEIKIIGEAFKRQHGIVMDQVQKPTDKLHVAVLKEGKWLPVQEMSTCVLEFEELPMTDVRQEIFEAVHAMVNQDMNALYQLQEAMRRWNVWIDYKEEA